MRRLSLPDAKVNQALRFVNLNYDNFDFITDSEDGFRAPIRANAKQSFDACLDLDVGSIHLDRSHPSSNRHTLLITLANAVPR